MKTRLCLVLALLALPFAAFAGPIALPATHWLGQSNSAWSGANWASDAAGTATTAIPDGNSTITFSATGAGNQTAIALDNNYTIKSLTVNDTAGISGCNTLTLTVTDSTTIGNGNFTLAHGVVLISNTGSPQIGDVAGTNGIFTVDGSGSQWTVAETLTVGDGGNGTLNVQNGGNVTDNYAHVGAQLGSTGNVIVDGPTSQWTTDGLLYIGDAGTGTLKIQNGGVATTNGKSYIGSNQGGTGKVTVDGAGSQWNAGTSITMNDGDGTLNVQNGGLVNVGNGNGSITLGNTVNGSGALNIGAFGGNSTGGTLQAVEVFGGDGNSDVNFNQTDSVTFAPVISGRSTVNQLGNGTTTLAANCTYTGPTKIYAGALYLNGNNNDPQNVLAITSDIFVKNGGTLAGNGTVGGNITVFSGGTIAAGGNATSIGILNGKPGFTNVALQDGSTARFKIAGPDSYDQLSVLRADAAGKVTLNLQLTGDYNGKDGDTFQVFVRVYGKLDPSNFTVTSNLGSQFQWDLSQLTVAGAVKIVAAPSPSPSPSPSPTATPAPTPTPTPQPTATPLPKPGTPAIDVGRKGGANERFNATGGSFTLTGTGVNLDEIRWNFLKGPTTKVKVSGTKWAVKISPLKKGVNTIQVSGFNTKTKKGSKPFNVVIIRN